MLARRTSFAASVFAMIALAALVCWMLPTTRSSAFDGPPANPDAQELTNGPVHEAFASPAGGNPTPSLVVPKAPPAPIEEMPPEVKPDGANVVWISGYWAWDDARQNFIWVSGIWRDATPNHVWVAGYWNQAADGYQWTPGFWTAAAQQEVSYVPQPPEEPNNEPQTPQPTANDFWVPGNWNYVDTRWVWQPGYWTAVQADWIWVPSHYVWTPGGYVFLRGHWDYALARRGVLFAPVVFAGPVYLRPHYVYTPAVVIDPGFLTVNFFVRPGYYHYYFGDCYGDAYARWGYRPWFSVGVGFGHDPLFSYYRWYNVRSNPRWAVEVRDHYTYLNAHIEGRPPRTYAEQLRVGVAVGGVSVGVSLNEYSRRTGPVPGLVHPAPVRFASLSQQQRTVIAHDSFKSNDIARERAKIETSGGGRPGAAGGTARSLNLQNISRSSGAQLPGASLASGGAGDKGVKSNGGAPSGTNKTTGPGGSTQKAPGTEARPRVPGNPTGPGSHSPSGPGTAKARPKDPNDKGNKDDPRSRFLQQPKGGANGVAGTASTEDSEDGNRAPNRAAAPDDGPTKDPIRPITVAPPRTSRDAPIVRGQSGSNDQPPQSQPQRSTDPIRPMRVAPPSAGKSNGGGPTGNAKPGPNNDSRGSDSQSSDPRGKDPIGPVRIGPPPAGK